MTFEPNQIIDNRYQIISRLGQGGMGAVWKAIDTKHDDEVVIKMPLNHFDKEILKRFGHEAKAMRKYSLDCPHILNIEDVGMLGEVPWYVMRFLPGGSARGQTPPQDQQGNIQWNADSFRWLTQIASALDYLHGRDCFHRDVKPENILFSSDGVPYLVDFGIVKNATETTTMMTEQGKVIGTLAYMAPEILEGEKFTAQSDQYALAVTLYESITGDRPFSGTTYFALFKAIQKGHPKLTELYSNVPKVASEVIDQALSEQPVDRFESCSEFANRFIGGLSFDASIERHPDTGVTPIPPVKPKAAKNLGGDQGQRNKKRLFEKPPKPVKEVSNEVQQRTWQRWAVDVLVSLAWATVAFLAIVVVTLDKLSLNFSDWYLLPIGGSIVAFVVSLFLLVGKIKSPTRDVWNSFLHWGSIAFVSAFWAFVSWIILLMLLRRFELEYDLERVSNFWSGMFSICVFLGLAFAIGKLTARPARDTFASFLACNVLALLCFWGTLYASLSLDFQSPQIPILITGLLALLATAVGFLWLQRKKIGMAFYGILAGVSGLLTFVIFFRCFYLAEGIEAFSGSEAFGGSVFLLFPLLSTSFFAVPFAVKRVGETKTNSAPTSTSNALPLVQLTIVVLSAIGIVVCWVNNFSSLQWGNLICLPACLVFLVVGLFALLYRSQETSVASSSKALDRLNFMRVRPIATIVSVLLIATLLMAVRFDWSFTLTKLSANLGNTRSMLHLVQRFNDGRRGVAEDDQEAFDWYLKAAERGNVTAQFELAEVYAGYHYYFDDYQKFEDRSQALLWYRKAAEQGHAEAKERVEELTADSSEEDEFGI